MAEARARLVILKLWLNHSRRKWSFEWNGVPISAPIVDVEFLDKLDRREFLIGSGDALDVTITYRQQYDPKIGVYVNDENSYVISKVHDLISRRPVTLGYKDPNPKPAPRRKPRAKPDGSQRSRRKRSGPSPQQPA